MDKWTQRFGELAMLVASWSKDPSTKVGAVIVRPDKTIASVGFNGFPRGVKDDESRYANRAEKYPRVVHAEMNAILNAYERLVGYTLYQYPCPPCSSCASSIIQSGISNVVVFNPWMNFGDDPGNDIKLANWRETVKYSTDMFFEAGVNFRVWNIQPKG